MLFFTDLDRTIVFSSKFRSLDNARSTVRIDDETGYPGFMDKEGYNLLLELYKKEELQIIPCTTRSIEETLTIKVFKDNSEYIICCNGGVILHNGKSEESWERLINCYLNGYEYYWSTLLPKFENKTFITKQPKFVNDIFVYGKHNDKQKMKNCLESIIDKELFYYEIQGKKFYIFPKDIKKGNALLYLRRKLEDNNISVAGDSKVDLDIFKYATNESFFVLNENSDNDINISDFKNIDFENLKIITNEGIRASSEILSRLSNLDMEKELNIDFV